MTRAARSPEQIDADRFQIAQLYLQRKPPKAIADELGYEYGVVVRDIAALRKQFREESLAMVTQRKNEELMRLDMMERKAWISLEESKERRKIRTDDQGRESITVEESEGDPRWLGVAQWCTEQRAKILGLYAPKEQVLQHNHSTSDAAELSEAQLVDIISKKNKEMAVDAEFKEEKPVEIEEHVNE
tara:strand:+ start:2145 stop:2705 length:561 start_codon:yes stop_codon:yes gene_type:complete